MFATYLRQKKQLAIGTQNGSTRLKETRGRVKKKKKKNKIEALVTMIILPKIPLWFLFIAETLFLIIWIVIQTHLQVDTPDRKSVV